MLYPLSTQAAVGLYHKEVVASAVTNRSNKLMKHWPAAVSLSCKCGGLQRTFSAHAE